MNIDTLLKSTALMMAFGTETALCQQTVLSADSDAEASFGGLPNGSRLSFTMSPGRDLNDDGYPDFLSGSADWSSDPIHFRVGRAFIHCGKAIVEGPSACHEFIWDSNGLEASMNLGFGSSNNNCWFGIDHMIINDITGDEFPEFAIGMAPEVNTGYYDNTGRVLIYTLDSRWPDDRTPFVVIEGEIKAALADPEPNDDHADLFGYYFDTGNLDGDSDTVDFVVSAFKTDLRNGIGNDHGRVYAFTIGQLDITSMIGPITLDIADPDSFTGVGEILWTRDGDANQDQDDYGRDLAIVGDCNGDTYDDVIVGAPQRNDPDASYNTPGRVELLSGLGDGNGNTTVIWDFDGIVSEEPDAAFGFRVNPAGLMNDDSVPDVLVSSHVSHAGGTKKGKVFLLNGIDGTVIREFHGAADYNHLGQGIAGIGDFNGDGYDDIAMGEKGWDEKLTPPMLKNNGRICIFFGPMTIDPINALGPSDADVVITGKPQSSTGTAINRLGNLDGDEFDDLVFTSVDYDDGSGNTDDNGRVYVFLGFDPSASVTMGDFNNDGRADVIDLELLIGEFEDGDPELGDMNGDGQVNMKDVAEWLRVASHP